MHFTVSSPGRVTWERNIPNLVCKPAIQTSLIPRPCHLQWLVACNMQIWRKKDLGDLVPLQSQASPIHICNIAKLEVANVCKDD